MSHVIYGWSLRTLHLQHFRNTKINIASSKASCPFVNEIIIVTWIMYNSKIREKTEILVIDQLSGFFMWDEAIKTYFIRFAELNRIPILNSRRLIFSKVETEEFLEIVKSLQLSSFPQSSFHPTAIVNF